MYPDFGTNIIDSLFEQNIDVIRENIYVSIQQAISSWLPYINIINLTIEVPDIDNNLTITSSNREHVILIKLDYSVGTRGANRSIILGINSSGNLGISSEQ